MRWFGTTLAVLGVVAYLATVALGQPGKKTTVILNRGRLHSSYAVPFAAELRLTGDGQWGKSEARRRLSDLLQGRWRGPGRRHEIELRATDRPGFRCLAPSREHLVVMRENGRRCTLLVYWKGGHWYACAADTATGKIGRSAVEFLDTDLDGDFSGRNDLFRIGPGAFHALGTGQLIPLARGLAEFQLESDASTVRLVVTRIPRPAFATAAQWDGLLALNRFRSAAGLPLYRLNEKRCAGCQAHAEYLYLNGDSPASPLEDTHRESKGKPGYSAEGELAARFSGVAYFPELATAITEQLATMLHRTLYLGPSLEGLGLGSRKGSLSGVLGYSVMWGSEVRINADGFPVVVPAPGQIDVPRFCEGEEPGVEGDPDFYQRAHGFPISVSYDRIPLKRLRIELFRMGKRQRGRTVAGHLFSQERPVNKSFDSSNARTAFFVAEKPLEKRATYMAMLTAETPKGGAHAGRFEFAWRFRCE